MSKPFHLFAEITPKPEFFPQARAALEGILTPTRVEEGCYLFDMLVNAEDGKLYLYEHWENQAALDFHYTQPYITEVFKSYEDWLQEPPRIMKMDKVAA